MSSKTEIVSTFFPGKEVVSISPLGSGRINETWLVEFDGGEPVKAVLQKVNGDVFSEPEHVMANLRLLADHLTRVLASNPLKLSDQWSVVSPFTTSERLDYSLDKSGCLWRMLSYIGGAVSYEQAAGEEQANEVGAALGRFHRLTSGLDPECFFDTLPGFHVTPDYLEKYDRVVDGKKYGTRSADENFCEDFIQRYRVGAGLLEEARNDGLVEQRVIHGDPKVSNIMFDRQTGKAVSIIDLDTVKPGLLHYDLGDCFRSSCNPAGGSGKYLDAVTFDLKMFSAVLNGYVEEMSAFLTDEDYNLMGPATCLISFELGLRYFTDHLQGDIYFRTDARGENLKRALGQFRLADDIRGKEREIQGIINLIRSKS